MRQRCRVGCCGEDGRIIADHRSEQADRRHPHHPTAALAVVACDGGDAEPLGGAQGTEVFDAKVADAPVLGLARLSRPLHSTDGVEDVLPGAGLLAGGSVADDTDVPRPVDLKELHTVRAEPRERLRERRLDRCSVVRRLLTRRVIRLPERLVHAELGRDHALLSPSARLESLAQRPLRLTVPVRLSAIEEIDA